MEIIGFLTSDGINAPILLGSTSELNSFLPSVMEYAYTLNEMNSEQLESEGSFHYSGYWYDFTSSEEGGGSLNGIQGVSGIKDKVNSYYIYPYSYAYHNDTRYIFNIANNYNPPQSYSLDSGDTYASVTKRLIVILSTNSENVYSGYSYYLDDSNNIITSSAISLPKTDGSGTVSTIMELSQWYNVSDTPDTGIKKAAWMDWVSPESRITVNRGDTIENIFELVTWPNYEHIKPFIDVSIGFVSITNLDAEPQESLGPLFYTVDGTSITIGERMDLSSLGFVATANNYVYGDVDNPIHPEGSPVRATLIVNIADPWDRTYDEGGTSSGGIGGGGSHSGPGGTISGGGASSYNTRGDLPIGSAEADSSNTGLFTRYALSATGLHGIARALYADTILQNLGKEVMSFLWNSPSEGLISLVSYPFNITSLPDVASSSVTSMKFGSLELPVAATKLGSTFAQIEWGTITLNEYWGNFLDYAPHTKIDLYLPWCTGSVSIDPHECLPGSLEVVTNIELAKGTCCHSIFGNKGALIGTYYGTCGSVLPLTAIDTSGKALALVTAAAGAMSAIGNAGAATSAGIAAANSPETTARAYSLELSRGLDPISARTMAQREAVQAAEAPYNAARNRAIKVAVPSAIAAFRTPANIVRNGSFVANGPGMAMQYPFIILSRPEQNVPANYAGHYGYPSNVLVKLGSTSGYTEVAAIHLDGISGATMNEIEEIDSLLKGGVIL